MWSAHVCVQTSQRTSTSLTFARCDRQNTGLHPSPLPRQLFSNFCTDVISNFTWLCKQQCQRLCMYNSTYSSHCTVTLFHLSTATITSLPPQPYGLYGPFHCFMTYFLNDLDLGVVLSKVINTTVTEHNNVFTKSEITMRALGLVYDISELMFEYLIVFCHQSIARVSDGRVVLLPPATSCTSFFFSFFLRFT